MFDEPGYRYSHQAMRTTFSFFFPTQTPGKYYGIAEDCANEITDIELAISPYQEGSDIHRLNLAAGTGEWIRVGWPTYSLLELCQSLATITNLAFNPFDGQRTMRVSGKQLDIQTQQLLDAMQTDTCASSVTVELHATEPLCRLGIGRVIDVGAIGKGWALDKCASIIMESGVDRAILSAGSSSMLAIGENWPIEIAGSAERIALSSQSLSVSRLINSDAGGIHIVGRTVPNEYHDKISRVIGDSCAITDALSTAAIVNLADALLFHPSYSVRIDEFPAKPCS